MTTDSNIKEIDKGIPNDHNQNYNPYELFTNSAIEDDLTFLLSSKCEYQIDAENKTIILKHKYLDYAERFLYSINVLKPIPKFEISILDIPQKLQDRFSNLDKKSVNSILTNVVRNILESVDHVYYHSNGIYGKAQWRVVQ